MRHWWTTENSRNCLKIRKCRIEISIGVGDGGREERPPSSPKKSGKYFSGNYYVKFGHFRAKKIMQNSGILLIFRANIIKIQTFWQFFGKNHVTFGHFVNFSDIFRAKMSWPLKLTELLRLLKFQWYITYEVFDHNELKKVSVGDWSSTIFRQNEHSGFGGYIVVCGCQSLLQWSWTLSWACNGQFSQVCSRIQTHLSFFSKLFDPQTQYVCVKRHNTRVE